MLLNLLIARRQEMLNDKSRDKVGQLGVLSDIFQIYETLLCVNCLIEEVVVRDNKQIENNLSSRYFGLSLIRSKLCGVS
jgi:hypothetical protein